MTEIPTAYSYIRFSSSEQAKGDSLRRQAELSAEYAQKHALCLDQSLRMHDLGISAYDGKNATEGALGAFIKGVETGRVKSGSYLLVESLDRLSRQEVDIALESFLNLIRRGITIVTLVDGMTYNKASIRENPTALMMSIMHMSLAHEESAKKSARIRAAKEHGRSQLAVKKITSICPAWLTLDKEKNQFVIIEERAKIIRSIFAKADKGIGKYVITGELNKEGVPIWQYSRNRRMARKWHTSYVDRLLNYEAVIGRYTPHKMVDGKRVPAGDSVPDYYPRIVTDALYERVRRHTLTNRTSAGRIGPVVANLFTHISFCEESGAPVIYINKKPYFYIRPDLLDSARYKSWPYEAFEKFFLLSVGGLDLGKIFGESESAINDAENKLGEARLALRDLEAQLGRLTDALTEGQSKTVMSRIMKLETEQNALEGNIQMLESNVARELELKASASNTAKNLTALIGQKDPQQRLLLRQEIRRIVKRIDIRFNVVPTAKEIAEKQEFDALVAKARAKGAKIGTSSTPASGRSIKITFTNGVVRIVSESATGEPIFAVDGDGSAIGRISGIFNPSVTAPRIVTDDSDVSPKTRVVGNARTRRK